MALTMAMTGTGMARFREVLRPSPLAGVGDVPWNKMVRLVGAHPAGDISPSGGYGSFALRPIRLVELGVMEKSSLHLVRRGQTDDKPDGRQVWEGELVAAYRSFLRDFDMQYDVFGRSMTDYDDQLYRGVIVPAPAVSRAGALIILHRAGPRAVARWPQGALSDTADLYERARFFF